LRVREHGKPEEKSATGLSVFIRRNGDHSRGEPVAKVRKAEGMREQKRKQRPPKIEFRKGESWVVKTTETIKLAPREKQIVVGKLEIPKRRKSPELVCVE
jgi:hypothetical protein